MRLESRTFSNGTKHIALYKDDGVFVKRLDQHQLVIDLLRSGRTDIRPSEIRRFLNEKEYKRLTKPKEPVIKSTVFDHIPFIGF